MHLANNLKLLRHRKGITQEALATQFGISRSTFNNYENEIVLNPSADMLITIATYFNIAIDTLLRKDLSKCSPKQLDDLTNGYDTYITGAKLRVLTTTVDTKNNDNNELVNVKASAGYASGFGDIDFVKKLPSLSLPFLSKERKYRTFQITGDSMLPIPDKSYIVAEFVENLNDLKNGSAYIIVTVNDGVVFKLVTNHIKHNKTILLSSLNTLYESYSLPINTVKEAWKFTHYISAQLPEPALGNEAIVASVIKLQQQINELRK
jgi:transcriptional regulator with XRE-family HTH domain